MPDRMADEASIAGKANRLGLIKKLTRVDSCMITESTLFSQIFELLRADTAERQNISMRLDKFLKVSRLIKRRTVANEACDAGRVMVNGKPAKASLNVKVGDIIEIGFGTKTVKVRVLDLQDTTKKEEAKDLFEYVS